MRYLFSLFLFFFSYSLSYATFCAETTFQKQYVNLYLCQNYSSFRKSTNLLFKARTLFLELYIEEKIRNGELEDKKFEIAVHDMILSSQHLDLSQGANGYFVELSGYPTLNELVSIVDYFSKSDWKPFFAGNSQETDPEVIDRRIKKFYKDNLNQLFDASEIKPFTVWSQDNLRIDYVNDDLTYYLDNRELPMKPTLTLPVSIKRRSMFFEDDKISVMEDGKVIKSIHIPPNKINEELEIYVYGDWVNICNGGEDNWIYSYSYPENRFYRRQGF